MGGRGASSGTSKAGNRYGSQYHALLTVGNVKYVSKNSKSSETLMETMTSGRVYVVVDRNEPKSIVYFDGKSKRRKQIDLNDHRGLSPHVHHGYLHNEDSPNGKPTRLTTQEKRMVDNILADWGKYKSGQ
ncbi:MAG: hypothetical protein Q4B69_08350 [Slackia sp.]|nr:hypothetical protein [Slackia sp.]